MRALPAIFLAACLAAAEPPPVPDPFGLGERLALIDHLQERYHVRLPGEPTLATLRTAYRSAWEAANPLAASGASGPADEAAASADRAARLRTLISRRHQVEADRGLDEAGLIDLLHRLDAEKAKKDADAVAALAAADAAAPRPDPPPAEEAPVAPAAGAAPAAPEPPAAGGVKVKRIDFPAAGVTGCILAQDGGISALLVAFGSDHNGAFRGMPGAMIAALHQATGIRRAVFLLGHGTGSTIGGEVIETHLKANKQFYETLGGTAPAQAVECLVFASCSAGNPNQMLAMRDGLGYFPTWRVATGNRNYANAAVVLAALRAVAQHPASPAWRGLFRFGPAAGEVSCFGEVGQDGERAETEYYRIEEDGPGGWKVVEQK